MEQILLRLYYSKGVIYCYILEQYAINFGSSPGELQINKLMLSKETKGPLFLPLPLFPPLHFEGVSQSCFDFVAAIFRLRKLLEFNKRFSQTKGAVEKPH